MDHKTAELAATTERPKYYEKSALAPSSSARTVLRVLTSTASHEEGSREATAAMSDSQSSAPRRPLEEPMCPEHLRLLKGNSRPRAPAAPTSLPSVTANLAPSSKPNPKKTLERPATLMRKTASSGFPHSDSKHGAPPFLPPKTKGSSSSLPPEQRPVINTMASTAVASARSQLSPAPARAYTAPISPTLLKDMEPPKKRQKISPILSQSNESRLNGAGASADSLSAPDSPEKRPEKERRTNLKQSKPSAKEPVRKMAPMRALKFADEPDNDLARPSVSGTTATSPINGSAEVLSQRNPPSRSVSLNLDQGGHIDRREIDSSLPPHPSKPTLTSRHESLEIFATTSSVGPSSHQPRTDYFFLEKTPSTSKRDDSSESPPIPPTETNHSTANNVSTPPRVKKTKKLVITTKARPPAKATRPVTPTDLDYFIYSQPGASTPPPGLEIPGLNKPPPASPSAFSSTVSQQPPKAKPVEDEPLALDIDPRIHYPRAHSLAWHAMKAQEIEARGTRKQRFGKAAQSLKKQMEAQAELNIPWEETLPDIIQENPAWVGALKSLRGIMPTPAVEAEGGGDPMDLCTNEAIVKSANGSGTSGPVVNGVERKIRKMKRTGSGLSVVSRDGVLSFGDRNGQGSGSVNGSFEPSEYGMN
ncbi:hypothetical protein QC764_212380 [Podospora pseudoanserina]|uniref:Uncharacterized protein n=1 Tax=Podospora pseudoanserina TaxID=2609844 RepID=A0ABR0IIZ7_9PEZI|nr:hypothetical protein QC764_212380 [Podospora pseudoanserina]